MGIDWGCRQVVRELAVRLEKSKLSKLVFFEAIVYLS